MPVTTKTLDRIFKAHAVHMTSERRASKCYNNILNRTNNIFELVTVEPVLTERPADRKRDDLLLSDEENGTPDDKKLTLKGQMIYMDTWKMMMYLGTPVMPDLNSLIATGLYINDLSMHDFSRDLMLAGTQQSVELKLALDQEQQKSKKLEESMRKLDEEMKRTDELLYQMIPKQVADRLRTGENPIDTCEMFDSVSILFSDVVSFTEICSRITPMEVVSMLNAMYSIFDTLTERNYVYKVETIGDAYMVVSGAPEKEQNHAEKVCDMALDMVEAITDLKDPSTGSHLQIRVGVHSGAVVAGIVGLKMPRYCLFGDSVNTASRMESTSEAMKIHISQSTRDLLSPMYKVTERGEIQVKGKGTMKTYWLEKREFRTPLTRTLMGGAKPEWEKIADRGSLMALIEERRVYSPVTYQDVARRSIAGSPIKLNTTQREVRSNSMGAMGMMSSIPSSSNQSEFNLDELTTAIQQRNPIISTKTTLATTSVATAREKSSSTHSVGYQPVIMSVSSSPHLPPTHIQAPEFWCGSRRGSQALSESIQQELSDVSEEDEPSGTSTTGNTASTVTAVTSKSDGNLCLAAKNTTPTEYSKKQKEQKETLSLQSIHHHYHHSHATKSPHCCSGTIHSDLKHRFHSNSCSII